MSQDGKILPRGAKRGRAGRSKPQLHTDLRWRQLGLDLAGGMRICMAGAAGRFLEQGWGSEL